MHIYNEIHKSSLILTAFGLLDCIFPDGAFSFHISEQ